MALDDKSSETSAPLRTKYGRGRAKTVQELTIKDISRTLRAKDGWWWKLKDHQIRARWEAELSQFPERQVQAILSDEKNPPAWSRAESHEAPAVRIKPAGALARKVDIQYAIDELEYYARVKFDFFGGKGEVGTDDAILSLDNVVSDDLRTDFVSAVQGLIDGSTDKDWHPGSNGTVLDIVHPSLCPYMPGFSPMLRPGQPPLDPWDCQFFARAPDASERYDSLVCWDVYRKLWLGEAINGADQARKRTKQDIKNFQWIPAKFRVDASHNSAGADNERASGAVFSENEKPGARTRILSYINNLHPVKHRNIYGLIEKVFSAVLPGFEYVLANSENPDKRTETEWFAKFDGYIYDDFSMSHSEDDEDDDDGDSDREAWERRGEDRWPELMQMYKDGLGVNSDPYVAREISTVDLKNRDLYVIVKIASIQLTPENPTYKGGHWHMEGIPEEDIVAVATWYFDIDNVSPSRLEFRRPLTANIDSNGRLYTEQRGFRTVSLAIERIAPMATIQNRVLVWPNELQHRVPSMELSDKTRAGHRSLVAFFLCNGPTPASSDRILPQDATWYIGLQPRFLRDRRPNDPLYIQTVLYSVFSETVADNIAGYLQPHTLSPEASRFARAHLMDQRKPRRMQTFQENPKPERLSDDALDNLDSVDDFFSLCEH